MQRRRILVLSFFPAFDPPSSGGETRLLQMWKAVSTFHDVTLLSSTHMHVAEEEIEHAPAFREIRVPKEEVAGAIWDELKSLELEADVSGLGVALAGRRFSALHRHFAACYDEADVIVHTSPFTLEYDLFLGLDAKPRVYESYNAEAAMAAALFRGPRAAETVAFVAALEARLLGACDLVTACTQDDLAALKALSPRPLERAIVAPNGVALRPSVVKPARGLAFRAVFVGSGHPPNRRAARFIVEDLAPRSPEIAFDIVGDCLEADAQLPANVTRHGRIDDAALDDLLARAGVVLNPVTEGGGSNLKVADTLARGLLLLSTPFGARGFDLRPGVHFVEAGLETFAPALRRIAAEPATFAACGEAARTHVASRFDWGRIAQSFSAALAELPLDRAGPFDTGLVLCLNDYPVSDGFGGGSTRIRGLYGELAKRTPVVVLTLWSGEGVRRRDLAPGLIELCVGKTEAHKVEERASNALHHASSADVLCIPHAPRNEMLTAVYDLLRRKAQRIVLDHIYMAGVPGAFGDRFVHSSHNHELALKRAILSGHPHEGSLLALTASAEAICVTGADLIVGVTADDLVELSRGRPRFPPSLVIPNGVPTPARVPATESAAAAKEVGPRSAVFLGSGHLPNVEAARFIAGDLASALAGVEFHFIGSVCDSLGDLKAANVRLWGSVSDARKSALLSACAIALNPVEEGGGSNVKLADYFAHGLAVLTTPFGLRGAPDGAGRHAVEANRSDFAASLRDFFERRTGSRSSADERRRFFSEYLSIEQGARRFAGALDDLSRRRRRVLFAPYRFGWPARGGAERHMLHFLDALAQSGEFDIDVATPDVEEILSASRFRSRFPEGEGACAPPGLGCVTVARFPVEDRAAAAPSPATAAIWAAQPAFERVWMTPHWATLREVHTLWGWSAPEGEATRPIIRALSRAALFVPEGITVQLALEASAAVTVRLSTPGAPDRDIAIDGKIDLLLPESGGLIEFSTEGAPALTEADPRPSRFWLSAVFANGAALDLKTMAFTPDHLPGDVDIGATLDRAAHEARPGLSLSSARGPQSPALESWMADAAGDYDLVIAHNAVFRTTAAAVESARAMGTPCVLIPQIHLEDDFYHFPDVERAIGRATVALVAPSSAVAFYRRRGIEHVRLLGAGYDEGETFTSADMAAFRAVHPDGSPFVLVLGRKAHAKNYRWVFDAVEDIGRAGLHVVMIGPDEDGETIDQPHVHYLGAQSRAVVRGALMACLCLANMSGSESFGMVVLEAWRAGRPVIVNAGTAAFRDLVSEGHNGLFATRETLAAAIERLLDDLGFADRMGAAGKETSDGHSWSSVSARFLAACRDAIASATAPKSGRTTSQEVSLCAAKADARQDSGPSVGGSSSPSIPT